MKFTEILMAALASIGTMVTANPVPDNQVAGLGNGSDWTAPVGYVCCKSIDKDGCHGCDFDKACPKDDVSKCPTGGFCCGFPAGAYPIETPTPTPSLTSTRKSSNSDALQTSSTDSTDTTTAGTEATTRKLTYRSAEEATAAGIAAGNWGTPTLVQWCSRYGYCEDYVVGEGCGSAADCAGLACCQVWSWD